VKSFETVVAGFIAAAGLVATPLMLAAPVFAAPSFAAQAVQTTPCPHPPECLRTAQGTSDAVRQMPLSTGRFGVIGGDMSNTAQRHDFDFQR